MSNTIYLMLENGKVFEGKSFGATGDITGEIVFTTGMTGYLETLTDPSYYGQIILQTFPLIGNYGVISSDFESQSICARGYIVKSPCDQPSNFRSERNLDHFLKQQNIVGLYGIDTRALTKIIRENGVMNGSITTQKPTQHLVDRIASYRVKNAVAQVSVKKPTYYQAEQSKYIVALLDFGAKQNICLELLKRHCSVWVFPHNTSPIELLSVNPDGIMLSNGPGDPAENTVVIEHIAQLAKQSLPMFGICLGHQLLALAHGFRTEKLKYGHRGVNQPVKDLSNDRVYITSQNHGYAVTSHSIDPSIAQESFVNLNDQTNEGLVYASSSIFSVQFHPEACAGPLDANFLFDQFIQYMDSTKSYCKEVNRICV